MQSKVEIFDATFGLMDDPLGCRARHHQWYDPDDCVYDRNLTGKPVTNAARSLRVFDRHG
jgi:hypothetical protein